ncbi:MAG: UbiD family decarboxylase [Deltaproteobacteria bacterium]|nr:UbiD family decarboxylase [Deltaproteobacteria bacterium]
MAFADLREWICSLEEKGQLRRIKVEVDWDEEIGAITREISSQYGPALLFDNIKAYQNTLCRRLFTNGTGTRERVCRLLGLSEQTSYRDLVLNFKERFLSRVEPRRVQGGPVKENVITAEAVDLYQLPVPKWNPLDGGRYIMTSASVVTMDPETKILNVGTYRGMISTKRTISVLLAATQGWGKQFTKYRQAGKEMPVAVVLGWDPTLLVASTPVSHPEYKESFSVYAAH